MRRHYSGITQRSPFLSKSRTGFNLKFSFSIVFHGPSLPNYLPPGGGRIIGFIHFPWILAPLEIYYIILKIIYYIILKIITSSLAEWVECSPMARETGVQSHVASYQRLLKWHLIPPCLTFSNIRYVLRVKWSNPGKGVAPSPTPWSSSY